MKSITILSLAAAVASAQAETDPTTSSTSVSTDIKDGKGTVTITVEKDGKKQTRTIAIDENTPFQALTDQIIEKLGHAGLADPSAPPKKSVTYLGVMLSEPASPSFGSGYGFGSDGRLAGGDAGGSSGGGAPMPTGLPPGTGLTVTGITSESPAEKAGLQSGDVLAKLNDQILINPAQFTTLVRTMKEGDVVQLSIFRQGERKEVSATLGSRIEESMMAGGSFTGPGMMGGPAGLPADIGRVLTIDQAGNVVEAAPGSLAQPPFTLPAEVPGPPGGVLPLFPPPIIPHPEIRPTQDARPPWESALREAAVAKEQAAAQWQEQLAKWRADWTENQKKATQEYRRAMEKMGEELGRAREAAHNARDEARRAIEEVMRKVDEQRKDTPLPTIPEPKPDAKPEAPEPESPKQT